MKAIIQRVSWAKVTVDEKEISRIGAGLLTLLGVEKGDAEGDGQRICEKVAHFRIFPDAAGKMNRSLIDIGGEHLIVSQFTLAANCSRGRRPGFDTAAAPETAQRIYQEFVATSESLGIKTGTGRFGADMKVELCNDGPVTFLL